MFSLKIDIFDKYQLEKIFPKKLIKTKYDILEIWTHSINLICLNYNNDNILQYNKQKNKLAEIQIICDKIKRIYFFTNTKYYSICFPFSIYEEENSNYKIKFKEFDIDTEITSYILRILKSKEIINYKTFGEIETSDEFMDIDSDIWYILKELIILEDGYIRYDYDLKNADGNIHPINHYDIFYTNINQIKIGLSNNIDKNYFLDTLDISKACKFLS
ncbi:hypothetical protein [Campylobacter sputorum]|uniref:hypothetical protein n=2 Tax=Campylobacter sputorum TaxID=206 RepID=UPI00053BDFCD|nr:hypothetical protein [Campylobacter sputorum]